MKKLIPLLSICALMWSAPLLAGQPDRISFGPIHWNGNFLTQCAEGYNILFDQTYYGDRFTYYGDDGLPARIFFKQVYFVEFYNSLYPDIRVSSINRNGDQRWLELVDGEFVSNDLAIHAIVTVPGYGIIRQHVGRVRVSFSPPGGVTFMAREPVFDIHAFCEILAP